jgi:hypothetical protein
MDSVWHPRAIHSKCRRGLFPLMRGIEEGGLASLKRGMVFRGGASQLRAWRLDLIWLTTDEWSRARRLCVRLVSSALVRARAIIGHIRDGNRWGTLSRP